MSSVVPLKLLERMMKVSQGYRWVLQQESSKGFGVQNWNLDKIHTSRRDSECKTKTSDKIDTSSKGFRVQPWIAFRHECLLSSVYLTMVQLANVSNISLVRRNSVLPLVGKGTFIQAWPWIAFLSCAWLLIELSLCGYGSTSWCFVLLLWWQMD
jgi:hypothetical protein